MNYYIEPATAPLSGELLVPGDKSITHRALILAALAQGQTEVRGLLDSADTRATLQVLQQLGVAIGQHEDGIAVQGIGKHGLQAPEAALDFGNSGTSARLMAGVLATQDFASELIGDASLMQRPMRRVSEPLAAMGADINTSAAGSLPLQIRPVSALHGIRYEMPVASAQIKSAILLAGLYADGTTTVIQPAPCRDHTERMLLQFGCPLQQDGNAISVSNAPLQATAIQVPADISSAAFFLVAASIVPGSDVSLPDVGMNPTRHAIVGLLQSMGADIQVQMQDGNEHEPRADLRVRYSKLRGIDIPTTAVPIAIDELPVLMIAAAVAEGTTTLHGAAELRVKESDRIAAMVAGLQNLGVTVNESADGMQVQGGALQGGEVDSFADHRIAMAFSIAGLAATGAVTVRDCANVATSFPDFVSGCGTLGGLITVRET
ncbi:MAG: 3-phosphoshikimate 1-carboxyvinyltransferase [Gammaproteobacteria bacterium]